jgi:hypothetical protein
MIGKTGPAQSEVQRFFLRPVMGSPVRALRLIRGSDDRVIFSDDTFFPRLTYAVSF